MIEIIAINSDDCALLSQSKIDRIELCSAMDKGGFTPDFDMIQACLAATHLPIRVMIRNSENFTTTEADIELMLAQIEQIKALPIEGFVFGCNLGEQINEAHLAKFMQAASPKKVTYHRAFDALTDVAASIKLLEQYQVDTILTTGGNGSIDTVANQTRLKQLATQSSIEILAGGGVNLANAAELHGLTGNIHIGSAVRVAGSFEREIDFRLLNRLCEQVY